MDFANEAKVKVGTYEGKAEVGYSESTNRFTITKINENNVASSIAGSLFGLLGRLLVKLATDSTPGKELGSFVPEEITQVKVSPTEYHVVYYFYSSNNPTPYEITIETDTYLNVTIKKLFSDKIVQIVAK